MRRPLVYDCFTFFNELELLEIRLEELADVVDFFVLVEASRTFTNQAKPFHFDENKRRFAKFLHRILHVKLPYMPAAPASPWELEAFQRDAIAFGLTQCRPEDYVMVSDVDEIPRAEAVRRFVATGQDAASFCMPFYYYKFNCRNVAGEPPQPLTVISRRRYVGTPQSARLSRHGLPLIGNAGWHFSFLGREERLLEKIAAFSHQEFNRPEFTDPGKLRARISQAADVFDREGFAWEFVPLDESFPKFLLANQDRFAHLIEPTASETSSEPLTMPQLVRAPGDASGAPPAQAESSSVNPVRTAAPYVREE